MIEQFDQIDSAMGKIEVIFQALKQELERLTKENKDLKGIIEDRDLEILQLQESVEKASTETSSEKNEVSNRLQTLLDRMQNMIPEGKAEQPAASRDSSVGQQEDLHF